MSLHDDTAQDSCPVCHYPGFAKVSHVCGAAYVRPGIARSTPQEQATSSAHLRRSMGLPSK